MRRLRIATLLIAPLLLVACKGDDPVEEFDRGAMLTNMASDVIKPSLNETASKLDAAQQSIQAFTNAPGTAQLTVAQTDFAEAYKAFQHCKMFDFGPMMDFAVKASLNTYPTDTAQIEANIAAGTYVLGSAENVDAVGFPALDYLLYFGGQSSVINSVTIATDAAQRKVYLNDLMSKMKDEFALVIAGWTSYEATFIAADGNDISSSTSLLFNEFAKDIELLKNAKIGIPAGEQTGGFTLPTYVEGYYSGLSLVLAQENVAGLKNAFNGGSGIGFDDYIKDVQGTEVSSSLADNINNQFDVCTQKLMAIGEPLSDKVDSSPVPVNEAWQEIKKLVTYTKTDMSSTLGLLITFQDNDGD